MGTIEGGVRLSVWITTVCWQWLSYNLLLLLMLLLLLLLLLLLMLLYSDFFQMVNHARWDRARSRLLMDRLTLPVD